MKNKRVLYIFLTLFFIVTLVLLSSVLFSVSNTALSPIGEINQLDNQKIQQKLNLLTGKNIFLVDENKVIRELEKENPYINVINIERVFPSSVILHYYERKELFEIETSGGNFAVIDKKGKVLKLSEQSSGLLRLDFSYNNINISDIISDEDTLSALEVYKVFTMLTKDNRIFDEKLFNDYFAKIYKESNNIINLKTHYGGEICLPVNNINPENLFVLMQAFEELDEADRASKKIYLQSS